MSAVKAVCGYLWNVVVALAWSLLLIAGALAGVDRRRTVRLTGKGRKRKQITNRLTLKRQDAELFDSAVERRLVEQDNPGWQADLEQALSGLSASKRQIQAAVGKARTAGAGTFDEAFKLAMDSLRQRVM